jgi:hypothetical protein
MRTIRRAIVAGALALPLTLGTAGIAFADIGYPDGNGTADLSFEETLSWAGPDGAGSDSTYANADGDGDATFEQDSATAGPDGATSDSVSASTGSDYYYNDDNNHDDYNDNDDYNHGGLLTGLLDIL